ncbi:hypothetical protein HZS_6736 [Henneguya salminicola]|uniref:Protein-glutamine gamma-glutamyltransferase 2 (Trinotate prediction) n=1 Tax=Henneguya salminicola TaxID=69463 RepID=A0A6G3ME90_HENSL|nr:hypothetical protein HZS_6736 [Henneguya salminicola]
MIDWKLFETEFYYLGRVYRDNHQAVELIYNELKNKTYLYNPNILVVRRGSSFYIRYSRLDGKLVSLPSINIIIETQSKGNIARVSLSQENISESGFEFSVRKTSKNQYDIELNVDINASVGLYTLHLADDHQPVGHALTIYIVFNAFHALDCVYIDSVSLIKAYLFNTQLKVYCGSEDYHFGKPYNLDQVIIFCIHFHVFKTLL